MPAPATAELPHPYDRNNRSILPGASARGMVMLRTGGRHWIAVLGLALWAGGCSFGPRALHHDRLRYNEAVKTGTEEQLLLNIVRLRYTDTPSSLAVTSLADQ